MTGLVIKLAPRERVLINGAVVENGDRRSRINILTQNAKVLRLRDAIHPDRANTPVSRLCYTLQLVLIGEAAADETRHRAVVAIEELSRIFTDTDSRKLLSEATSTLSEGNFYRCLKCLRNLLPREARLLAMGTA